jgi:hypothetical protein
MLLGQRLPGEAVMPGMSVGPYQDITFDRDGDVDPAQRDRLLGTRVTDLVLFAHGWNNSPSVAHGLCSAFFAPFPGLLAPGVQLGYAGVVWPSMKFTDEPVPGFAPGPSPAGPEAGPTVAREAGAERPATAATPAPPAAVAAAGPEPKDAAGSVPAGAAEHAAVLDEESRGALKQVFPGHEDTVERLGALLDEQPDSAEAFAEFGRLARLLAEAPAGGLEADCFTDDLPGDEQGPPALLYEDALGLCRRFALALEAPDGSGGPAAAEAISLPYGLRRTWKGAKELLRQTTYYAMKRRAGAVGELGLGPLLGQLALTRPHLRVHLVGHSQGARLVCFALRGLPDGVRNVKSVTLLQGAFSHYAFAPSLPHAPGRSGALRSLEQRVDGPVVACHSRHDSALGVMYPMASSLARDDRTLLPDRPDRRWWAVGYDGFRAVAPPARLTLGEALANGLPATGCVSVDATAVVRRGGPPSGAHSDICHEELARVVVAAGRIGP